MKVLPGILLGLAAGAAVGLLLAPESGKKTRKRITLESNSFVDDLQHQLQSGLDTIRDQFDHFLETASKKSDEVVGQAKRKIHN
jgi:gas vesicle protein